MAKVTQFEIKSITEVGFRLFEIQTNCQKVFQYEHKGELEYEPEPSELCADNFQDWEDISDEWYFQQNLEKAKTANPNFKQDLDIVWAKNPNLNYGEALECYLIQKARKGFLRGIMTRA